MSSLRKSTLSTSVTRSKCISSWTLLDNVKWHSISPACPYYTISAFTLSRFSYAVQCSVIRCIHIFSNQLLPHNLSTFTQLSHLRESLWVWYKYVILCLAMAILYLDRQEGWWPTFHRGSNFWCYFPNLFILPLK